MTVCSRPEDGLRCRQVVTPSPKPTQDARAQIRRDAHEGFLYPIKRRGGGGATRSGGLLVNITEITGITLSASMRFIMLIDIDMEH